MPHNQTYVGSNPVRLQLHFVNKHSFEPIVLAMNYPAASRRGILYLSAINVFAYSNLEFDYFARINYIYHRA